MAAQKWMPIDCCNNYRIGSNGMVKRLKHKSNGKRYKILPMMYVEQQMNRSGVVYVKLIDDQGKQKVFSIQKLVMKTFLESGHTYYKTSGDPFSNRVDQFVRSDVYDRMKFKPVIYKTIRL